ncbi:MAG: hypothetical protein IT534_06230 [Bauldia sp.]|nr:hypothetical protein [Bauldia sp.]
MTRLARPAALLALCLAVAACAPTTTTAPAPTTVTAGGAQTYLCPIDGAIRIATFGSYVVLTTSNGVSETYTGAMPAYFGEESSLTFSGSSVVWAGLGERQTCIRA